MKCFRVRFTVRQMMIAVAVVAILTTAGLGVTPELSRRWNDCQVATNRQAQIAQMHATTAAAMNTMLARGVMTKAAAEQAAQRVAVHHKMSRRNWWAFFDPFHECVLDRDIY
jgi:type II secretory pathway component PulJ